MSNGNLVDEDYAECPYLTQKKRIEQLFKLNSSLNSQPTIRSTKEKDTFGTLVYLISDFNTRRPPLKMQVNRHSCVYTSMGTRKIFPIC